MRNDHSGGRDADSLEKHFGCHRLLRDIGFGSTYAHVIALRFHAKIHLLHVIRPQAYEFLPPGIMPVASKQIHQNAQQLLQSLSDRLSDVATQTWLKEGFIGESVKSVAFSNHVDLIVIGTQGLGNLEKLTFGSAAEEIHPKAERVGIELRNPAMLL